MSGIEPRENTGPDENAESESEIPDLPSADVIWMLNSVDASTRHDIMNYTMQVYDFKREVATTRYKTVRNGQVFAFVLCLVVLGASVGLILTGFQTAGTIIGGLDLVALASAFLAVASGQKKGE